MAIGNAQVNAGGVGCHAQRQDMGAARKTGVEFVNISPGNRDILSDLDADWLPIRPNTDMSLMLALAYTLVVEDLHDKQFLARYCTGFDKFLPYLTGTGDGVPKDARWAEKITGIAAGTIIDLAR